MTSDFLTAAVVDCARCGYDHPRLDFKRLTRPMQRSGYTHWTTCPLTKEPLLMVWETDAPASIEPPSNRGE